MAVSSHLNHRLCALCGAALFGLTLVSCSESTRPSSRAVAQATGRANDVTAPGDPNSAAGDEKAFIHGWLDGETVELRYTRSF